MSATTAREAMLDAVKALLQEKGIDCVTTAEIACRTGLKLAIYCILESRQVPLMESVH